LKEYQIFFRVDGNSQIGLGHLVRCVALAHMLKNEYHITFYSKAIPLQIIKELSDNGFDLFHIEDEFDFLKKITNKEIVVLDGYQFDTEYQNQIKLTGCKLVCIDDLYDKEFVADLIINHAPGIKPECYKARYYTKFALGLPYALLRRSFLEQAKIKRIENKKIEALFICFGGSDFKNLTEATLVIAKKFNDFKQIIIVTGAAYTNTGSLKQIISQDERIIHYHAIQEDQMLAVLKEADLAIVPASGMLFEVLTLQIPVITGWYVNNQSVFISEMIKYKQVINSNDFSDVNLTQAIKKVLNAKTEYDIIFDGESGKRISNLFKSL
jgi:UDP-2,4-diacetamido-2,4,6-trideoxy-beta-L-altropyranose hydrolase